MKGKEDKKYNTLVSFCENYDAKIIRYEYYKSIFGNFVIQVEYKGELHKFVTDKGEIYLDSTLLCDGSYHIAGQDDTFTQLLEMMKKELFEKQ